MTNTKTSPEQENTFYADPEAREPQGPPIRRRSTLSEAVPVRFPAGLLSEVRQRAAVDDRSVSNWIRRAAGNELARKAS